MNKYYVTASRRTESGNTDLIMREEGDTGNNVYITTLPSGDVPVPGTRIEAELTAWVDVEGNPVAPVVLAPQSEDQTEVTIHRVDLDKVGSVSEPTSRAASNLAKLKAAGWAPESE